MWMWRRYELIWWDQALEVFVVVQRDYEIMNENDINFIINTKGFKYGRKFGFICFYFILYFQERKVK